MCTTVAFTLRALSPSVWMITPQLTAQYGQVERVSVVRAIFSSRTCAYAGCRSNPKTDAATPPTVLILRKSLRLEIIGRPPPSGIGAVPQCQIRLACILFLPVCQARQAEENRRVRVTVGRSVQNSSFTLETLLWGARQRPSR